MIVTGGTVWANSKDHAGMAKSQLECACGGSPISVRSDSGMVRFECTMCGLSTTEYKDHIVANCRWNAIQEEILLGVAKRLRQPKYTLED